MRIFNNESMWDAENQKWYDTYSINNEPVDEETYHEQLEVEMLVADDEMELEESYDSRYDVSSECANCVGCDEHCGRGNHDEYENYECEDNELKEQCECPICQAEQEVKELDCFCEECSEDYMKEFIDECLEHIFNGCPDCAIESVVKLAFKCKELGIESAKYKMYEFLEN